MSNKEILRRLHELEVKLQKETQAKANLEVDFQHLLDQLKTMERNNTIREDEAIAWVN